MAALDSPDYYQEIGEKLGCDKEAYYRRVGTLPGVTTFRSDANFLLVEIPPDSWTKLKDVLVSQGLMVKFMDEPLLKSHIRITLGTQEQNERVMVAFEKFFRR